MSERMAQLIGLLVVLAAFVVAFLLISSAAAALGHSLPWDR